MEVSNETDNATNQFGTYEVFFKLTADKYVASITQWLVFTASIIGNGLILLLAICKKIQASKVSLFLICSLAATDLLLSVGATWTDAIVDIVPAWFFGPAWCKIHNYTRIVACNASVGILVVIAIERCFQGANADPKTMVTYSVIMCVLNFFIPLIITWTVYSAILCKMWRSRNKVAAHGGGTSTVQHKPVARKVTVMCVLVVLAFTITWTPLQILLQVGTFMGFTSVFHLIRHFYVLTVVSTAINPVIYGFLWKPFRLAIRKLCGCSTAQNGSSTMTAVSTVRTQLAIIPGPIASTV